MVVRIELSLFTFCAEFDNFYLIHFFESNKFYIRANLLSVTLRTAFEHDCERLRELTLRVLFNYRMPTEVKLTHLNQIRLPQESILPPSHLIISI